MELERIVERIYKIAKKTHRTKLLPETLIEVLGNSKTIFNSNETQTAVFKEIIKSQNIRGIHSQLAKKYNLKNSQITKIKDNMVEKMYLSDTKRRFEKMTFNEKFSKDVEMLGLDNKTTDFLKELHCEKIKDIYNLDEKYFEEICIAKQVNYKKIINRLRILGIERIIKRIEKTSKYTHRNKILPETIMEILSDSKTIFNSDERHTTIFREIITQQHSKIQAELAQKYNVKVQRISQIQYNMVEKMYLSDSIRRFQKLNTNDEKLNVTIDNLGLDNKTTDFLKELHCEKVKDIYDIDKKYLRDICATKNIDYRNLTRRLEILDIKDTKSNNHLKSIEELYMPPCAYRYIKQSGISTNQELVRNIDCLLNDKKIRQGIKEKIKELYIRILEELNEIDINEDSKIDEKKM